jgi:threonine/homoserine/homoserine lactone efflux protein
MTYIVIVNTCVTLHTRRGIVSALGVLVVDIVLLLTMLIGLLRHAQKSSIGIWKLLYQQVTLKTLTLCCVKY